MADMTAPAGERVTVAQYDLATALRLLLHGIKVFDLDVCEEDKEAINRLVENSKKAALGTGGEE